jgi:hypothetical protein
MTKDTEIDAAAYHAALEEVIKIEEENGIIRTVKNKDTPTPEQQPQE